MDEDMKRKEDEYRKEETVINVVPGLLVGNQKVRSGQISRAGKGLGSDNILLALNCVKSSLPKEAGTDINH